MDEVPQYSPPLGGRGCLCQMHLLGRSGQQVLEGYLGHKKQAPLLGPPCDPRYTPTVGSQEGGVYYWRGTPAALPG